MINSLNRPAILLSYYLNQMNFIKKMLPAGLASIMIAFAVMTLGTSADENDPETHPRFNAERHEEMAERHEQMMEIVEAGDYTAFVEALGDSKHGEKLLEVITEENFPKFVEMHDHMKQARDIAEELGLPQRDGKFGRHMMKGRHGGKWKQEANQE